MYWIKPKDQLPPEKVLVMARNPYIESISWIDGKDELGKPSWSHDTWEHADGFVSEWRWLTGKECEKLFETYGGSKMEKYECKIGVKITVGQTRFPRNHLWIDGIDVT